MTDLVFFQLKLDCLSGDLVGRAAISVARTTQARSEDFMVCGMGIDGKLNS